MSHWSTRWGDYAAAAGGFEKILAQRADDSDAHLYLGNSLLMTGRYERAIAVLERARELDDSSSVNFALGQAALGAGDVERAAEALARAVEIGGISGGAAAALLAEIRPD